MRSPLLLTGILLVAASAFAGDYTLAATPSTVAWGYYWAQAKPVLTIHSGDTVRVQTASSCPSPERLEKAGLPAAEIPQFYRDIYAKVTDKGPGGHILTGPIAIAEAEAGDVLEVRIIKIDVDVAFACNVFAAGRGFLPDDFPYSKTKIVPLRREYMMAHREHATPEFGPVAVVTAEFDPGVVIPVRPFFGSMGVAPPETAGRINSAPPWIHAGNMDLKDLVAGTTLFIPIHAKGALFEVGDGHAAQGNGEVDITALETFLTGTFQFIVHKQQRLLWPRAETPTQYISMGFHEDLNEATKMAVRNMIDFLVTEKHLTRDDAYMLTSIACDVDITQLVDGKVGVHTMCPKALFSDRK